MNPKAIRPTPRANTKFMKGHSQERGFDIVRSPITAWISVVMTAPARPNSAADTRSQVYVFMYHSGVALPPVAKASARSAKAASTPATTPMMRAAIVFRCFKVFRSPYIEFTKYE